MHLSNNWCPGMGLNSTNVSDYGGNAGTEGMVLLVPIRIDNYQGAWWLQILSLWLLENSWDPNMPLAHLVVSLGDCISWPVTSSNPVALLSSASLFLLTSNMDHDDYVEIMDISFWTESAVQKMWQGVVQTPMRLKFCIKESQSIVVGKLELHSKIDPILKTGAELFCFLFHTAEPNFYSKSHREDSVVWESGFKIELGIEKLQCIPGPK